jgi:tetratricopeptide (TPR) repeat protein
VRLDSTFGLAWGRLAWAETYVYNEDVGGPENDSVAALAKQAADRALALAPELGQTYNAIAAVRHVIYRDYLGAIAALERARALAPHDVDILTQLAIHVGEFLGRWDQAMALCAEATRLDPRSPLVARRYAAVLVEAHRFRAADSLASVALRTAPDNLALLFFATVARLNQGDLSGARAVLQRASAYVPARRFTTKLPVLVWLLDDSLRGFALRLPPEAFGGDRATGLMTIADLNWDQGRYGAARASAASARPLLEHQVGQRPADEGPSWTLARAYAYLGRCAEAVQLRERLRVTDRDKPKRVESNDLASDRLYIAVRCGDYAGAVAWVDTLIHAEFWRENTPAWFRLHPAFAPLHGRPDFERLVAGK